MLALLMKRRANYLEERTIKYVDPLHLGRHPFQTFLMVLGLISSVTLILNRTEPASLEATLPQWLVFLWAAMLVSGCSLALLGAYWPRSYTAALTMERIGLDFTGIAGSIYGTGVIIFGGIPALLAAGIVLAFGAACLVRARDIALIFHTSSKIIGHRHEVR